MPAFFDYLVAMNFASSPARNRAAANLAPYAAMLGAILTLVIGTSLAKQLFPLVGAEATSGYRVGFAAILLLLIWRPWRTRLATRDLLAVAQYGAVMGLMNLSFYMALRTIPLGVAIAIEFLGPLTVALLLSRRLVHFGAVGLAVAGLALLLPIRATGSTLDPTGVAYALMAAICWGLYIVLGKRASHLHSGHAVSLGMATAALIVVPVGIYSAGADFFTLHFMLVGLGAAILSSAIPYSLEMVALKHIPPRNFGVLVSIEPAVGAIAGVLLLGEMLSAVQWLAIMLVVGASVVTVATGTASEAVDDDMLAQP